MAGTDPGGQEGAGRQGDGTEPAGHTLTDANAKRIVEQTLAAEKEIARLKDKHFRKLLKALPAHRAARYVQVENKIQAVVAYEGAKAVPLAR